MPTSRRETVNQFLRFFLVGVSNTAVDFSVYFFLTRAVLYFGDHIFFANTISFIVAATWSYFANRTWTFKRENRATVGEAVRFYTSTVTTFAMNMLTLYIVVHGFGGHDLIGKILASGVSMVSNFTLSKLWVFNR